MLRDQGVDRGTPVKMDSVAKVASLGPLSDSYIEISTGTAPAALLPHLALRDDPRVLFAGQLTGVEGYTESTATGLLAGVNLSRLVAGEEPVLPPPTTMLGALYRYMREADPRHFQPMNANFGLVDDLAQRVKDKRIRKERLAERALADMTEWRDAHLLASSHRS